MNDQSARDVGGVIRPDQAAFVIDPDGRISLLLPSLPEDAHLSTRHRLLLAFAARLHDPDWVEELLSGAKARKKLGFL